jgi:hypothetical protein
VNSKKLGSGRIGLKEGEGIMQQVGFEYNKPVPVGTFWVIPGSVSFSIFQKTPHFSRLLV